MSTHIGQITPDLDSCHVIRSHRAPSRKLPVKRASIAVALVVALSGTTPPISAATPQAPAQATTGHVQVVEPTTALALSERTVTVSRSVRAVSARTAKINKVISFAKAQQGDKYKWGAAGPNRWDCSGLIMKSFAKAGKKLPHQTGGIQKKGKKVSKKNLKRGDIVFPQKGHVGIYLGGGKMVHASSGKGKVVVAKVYGFYTARRVI